MKDLLNIRSALITDLIIYFKWVNEEVVRKNSFNSKKITLNDHEKWYLNKLKSKKSHLLIFEKDSIPIGQIRFDIKDNIAHIDYSIEKKYRGKGLGGILLKMGIKHIINDLKTKNIISFKAEVKTSNISSKKIFENNGFKKKIFNHSSKVIFEKLIKT